LVGEGYKYPSTTTTPTIQAFNTPHSIQEQSATLQDTNQSHRSDQNLQFNSSALGLVRGSLVFLVALVCLAWLSFFSLLTLKCFVSEARDTNCVVVLVGSK
jgi:ABC-type multidrug transport system permease subunit